jgi:hypothetical protein
MVWVAVRKEAGENVQVGKDKGRKHDKLAITEPFFKLEGEYRDKLMQYYGFLLYPK